MFPLDEVEGNIEIQGKQNSLFPKWSAWSVECAEQSIDCDIT